MICRKVSFSRVRTCKRARTHYTERCILTFVFQGIRYISIKGCVPTHRKVNHHFRFQGRGYILIKECVPNVLAKGTPDIFWFVNSSFRYIPVKWYVLIPPYNGVLVFHIAILRVHILKRCVLTIPYLVGYTIFVNPPGTYQ